MPSTSAVLLGAGALTVSSLGAWRSLPLFLGAIMLAYQIFTILSPGEVVSPDQPWGKIFLRLGTAIRPLRLGRRHTGVVARALGKRTFVTVEVIGIDHIYVSVSDLRTSEAFYDPVMAVLGFHKREAAIDGDIHILYHNRHFGYVLRPVREGTLDHNPYAPGLHHFCFRVVDEAAVDRCARQLREAGAQVTEPRYYPEYDPDYYATFFEDTRWDSA